MAPSSIADLTKCGACGPIRSNCRKPGPRFAGNGSIDEHTNTSLTTKKPSLLYKYFYNTLCFLVLGVASDGLDRFLYKYFYKQLDSLVLRVACNINTVRKI